MENHFSTSQEASTTPASLGNIGRTGCLRCTWLDSMLFRCTWNRATVHKLHTQLCYTYWQKSFGCFHAGMCHGTSMRLCRGCTTLQVTEILSTSWTWPTRRGCWSSCDQGRTSVQNGKWWLLLPHVAKFECFEMWCFTIGQWASCITACDYENMTLQGVCFYINSSPKIILSYLVLILMPF